MDAQALFDYLSQATDHQGSEILLENICEYLWQNDLQDEVVEYLESNLPQNI